MLLIVLVCLMIGPFQEEPQLSPDNQNWLRLAQPLMSPLEWQEAQKLADSDFASFQATWIQARRPVAAQWPSQGLNLPAFYAPKRYGDQRDTVYFLWGEPREIQQSGNRLECTFDSDKSLIFEKSQGKWVLEGASQLHFAESQIIRRVPYSTGHHPFGATRIPPELSFGPALIEVFGREPNGHGQRIQLRMLTPAPFFRRMRRKMLRCGIKAAEITLLKARC